MNQLKRSVQKEREKVRKEHLISTGLGMVEQYARKLKDLDPRDADHHALIMHYLAEMQYWGTAAEKWMNHVEHKG